MSPWTDLSTPLTLYRRSPYKTDRGCFVNSECCEIREGFRSNTAESDEAVVTDLLNRASSKLDFIKIVSGRRPPSSTGSSRFVMRDGELVEVVSDPSPGLKRKTTVGTPAFDRSMISDQDRKRHADLVRRQYFMDRR